GRWAVDDEWSLALRSSANVQSRRRRIGLSLEHEQQGTLFGELTATAVTTRNQVVMGMAWQRDSYSNRDVSRFDQTTSTPGLFVQHTLTVSPWLATTLNG